MNHGNIQQLLTPPEQFGIVEPGIYRSDMLQPLHFPFIKAINFKTVVMLSPEMPNRVTSNLMDECGMKLVRVFSYGIHCLGVWMLIKGYICICIGSSWYGHMEANAALHMATRI